MANETARYAGLIADALRGLPRSSVLPLIEKALREHAEAYHSSQMSGIAQRAAEKIWNASRDKDDRPVYLGPKDIAAIIESEGK
jgi:hypothetical protein